MHHTVPYLADAQAAAQVLVCRQSLVRPPHVQETQPVSTLPAMVLYTSRVSAAASVLPAAQCKAYAVQHEHTFT